MKKAIIHIGGHKTGTTAIQQSLFDSSSSLIEQGVCYPVELTCKDALFWGQHSLAWQLMDEVVGKDFVLSQNEINKSLDTLSRLKNQHSNLILSSENFIKLEHNAVSRLKEELADFDIYVVIYVRRQDDAALALYQTNVIHYQGTKKFDDWLKNKTSLFDYYSIIKKWESATKGKIIVRPYNRSQLSNGDVVSDFNVIINNIFEKNLSLKTSNQNLFNNKSVPDSITRLVRYYNTTPTKQKIRPALIRLGYELSSVKAKSSFQLISPSMRQAILDKFREGNAKLSKEYLDLKELWFNDIITENDDEWKKNNTFNGSDLLALVNEALDVITLLKEKNS